MEMDTGFPIRANRAVADQGCHLDLFVDLRFTGVQLARRRAASASARQARPFRGARTTTRPCHDGEATWVSWALMRRGVVANSPRRSALGTSVRETVPRRDSCAGMT